MGLNINRPLAAYLESKDPDVVLEMLFDAIHVMRLEDGDIRTPLADLAEFLEEYEGRSKSFDNVAGQLMEAVIVQLRECKESEE